jgi:hypothetical protein
LEEEVEELAEVVEMAAEVVVEEEEVEMIFYKLLDFLEVKTVVVIQLTCLQLLTLSGLKKRKRFELLTPPMQLALLVEKPALELEQTYSKRIMTFLWLE